jgi:hypothetical protein
MHNYTAPRFLDFLDFFDVHKAISTRFQLLAPSAVLSTLAFFAVYSSLAFFAA